MVPLARDGRNGRRGREGVSPGPLRTGTVLNFVQGLSVSCGTGGNHDANRR